MEDKNQGKPPLLTPPTKQERKKKSAGEKAETEKKLDQARGQTRINKHFNDGVSSGSLRTSETMP